MTKVWVLLEADLHLDDPIGDTPVLGVFSSREAALAYAELVRADMGDVGEMTWSDGHDDVEMAGSWAREDHWVGLLKATPAAEGGLFQVTAFEVDEP